MCVLDSKGEAQSGAASHSRAQKLTYQKARPVFNVVTAAEFRLHQTIHHKGR